MQRETKYNLMGQRFGKLVVIDRAEDIEREWNGKHISRVAWLCKCNCGRTKIADQGSLLSGNTKTCGNKECRKGRRVIRNKYDLSGEFGKGWTRNGVEFWFDKEDYDLIKDYNWGTDEKGYIEAIMWDNTDGSQHKIKLSRLVMGVLDNKDFNCQVDHRDRNKLDNRKENLRIVDNTTNNANKNPYREDGSKIGVRKFRNKWVADITINDKIIHLGSYDNYENAVQARLDAEKKYKVYGIYEN